MFTLIVSKLAKVLTGPLLSFGERWLETERDKEKLKAGTDRLIYELDSKERMARQSHWMGRLPTFILCTSVAIYLSSVYIDSTWPSNYLNPVELPDLFKEHLTTILAYMVGIAALDKFGRRKGGR